MYGGNEMVRSLLADTTHPHSVRIRAVETTDNLENENVEFNVFGQLFGITFRFDNRTNTILLTNTDSYEDVSIARLSQHPGASYQHDIILNSSSLQLMKLCPSVVLVTIDVLVNARNGDRFECNIY